MKTRHPFTQLVLRLTFSREEWNRFKADADATGGKFAKRGMDPKLTEGLRKAIKILKREQWEAIVSRDPAKMNDEIQKEYTKGAGPPRARASSSRAVVDPADLVGSMPLIIKDWPAHG